MKFKEHNLRAIALILVFFSYFAWRFSMIGPNPIIIPFILVAAFALLLMVRNYCKKPKNDKKRKEDRTIFIAVLALFLLAVIGRILFLS